jgi:excisionase family DNA binding protein
MEKFPLAIAPGLQPPYSESMSTSIGQHDPVDSAVPTSRAQLLTVADVVVALRISRSSVYRLFDSGELPWIQIGSSRRVRSEDLKQFIDQHRRIAS